jgi:hypothetical protein
VRLEGLVKLKKVYLIGARTSGLPACSTMPEPTTLPRAHNSRKFFKTYKTVCDSVMDILTEKKKNFIVVTQIQDAIRKCEAE